MSQTLAKAAKRKVQKKNTIDPELQQKLVCEEILQKLGTVKDFHKINAVNVYYDKWRVDIWTKTWGEKEVRKIGNWGYNIRTAMLA